MAKTTLCFSHILAKIKGCEKERGLSVMHRDIEQDLLQWKQHTHRLPLLVRGARQVGKSYVIEKFGQEQFDNLVTINFELQPEFIPYFETLEPIDIINRIAPILRQKIVPGSTLLFLDEIQDCPNAIRALRYFKEKMPQLHVIGAGSLLEFALNASEFRMPVGRVQSIYLKPLSFKEYLTAAGYTALRELIEQVTLATPLAEPMHQKLLKLVREYMALGGMPAVLQEYFTHPDIAQCQHVQTSLLNTYRQDFGKYAKKSDHQYLQRLFEKAPGLIGEYFQYVKIDPDMRSRDIKNALEMLHQAGLVYPVYSTAASGIPLISLINERKFKILFVDIGLVMRATKLETDLLMSKDILLVNRGMLAEQFVGQELLVYASRFDEANLYFWSRDKPSSQAQIDYVITVGSRIIPIEVKAGTTGQLKSLRIFMDEKKLNLGVRVSQFPLSFDGTLLSVPIYMVGEIERLVRESTLAPTPT